jgi:hypothetical protein
MKLYLDIIPWTVEEIQAHKGCQVKCLYSNGIGTLIGRECPNGYNDMCGFVQRRDGSIYGEDRYSFCEDHVWRKDKKDEWKICGRIK